MPTPEVRLIDHSEFPNAAGADMLAMLVTKAEVEARQISKALASLIALTDEPDKIVQYRRRLVLFFHGYDFDPREIYEIPEVVSWFHTLAREWSAWIHYVAWDVDPTQLAIVIRLMLGNQPLYDAAVRLQLAHLAEAHARFGRAYGLSEDQVATDVRAATAALYV